MSWKQSAVIRKGRAFLKQGLKRVRPPATDLRGPLLVNSFPKSGTHLLYQVVKGLPGLQDYESFLASTPSLTMRERPTPAAVRKITSWVPGEIVRGHLFYSSEAEAALESRSCLHLFIYRDPRDVVCSEAHYLATMNRWHRLHATFKALPDEASRIQFAIEGDIAGQAPVAYLNIRERFARYAGWLQSASCYPVRFEDLLGAERGPVIEGIIRHLQPHFPALDESAIAQCLAQIQPEKSHTFRKGGGVSSWSRRFTPKHKETFKALAGDLLIELGYEKDLNW